MIGQKAFFFHGWSYTIDPTTSFGHIQLLRAFFCRLKVFNHVRLPPFKKKSKDKPCLFSQMHKPCSVYAVIYLYLSISGHPFDSFWPTPLPNLGFSLVGFTRSTSDVSIRTRLCGTFKLASLVSLRIGVAVN